jgi:hypothetical protein
MTPRRTNVYIDGFNLYFGLKSKGWRHLYWFSIASLAAGLVRSPAALHQAHYFTARISGPTDKRERQSCFLDANQATGGFSAYFGTYREDPRVCRGCGRTNISHNEKKTDVNIAVQMLADAFRDQFDQAILVSADADLVPAISAVRQLFPSKSVIVGFPPGRYSKELAKTAGGSFHVSRTVLASSQLSDQVRTASGVILQRPREWQ